MALRNGFLAISQIFSHNFRLIMSYVISIICHKKWCHPHYCTHVRSDTNSRSRSDHGFIKQSINNWKLRFIKAALRCINHSIIVRIVNYFAYFFFITAYTCKRGERYQLTFFDERALEPLHKPHSQNVSNKQSEPLGQ